MEVDLKKCHETVSIFEDKILPCKIIETAVYIALKTSSFFHAFRKPQFCMHWHFIFQILSNAGRRHKVLCITHAYYRNLNVFMRRKNDLFSQNLAMKADA